LDRLREQDKSSDESEGWLKVNVIEAQNVPFENSSIQIETESDTFATSYEPSRFPKFNQNYKFFNLRQEDIAKISLIGESAESDQNYANTVKMSDLSDQKLHDKWITLIDIMSDRITDIKVRIVMHYVYSPIPLCEEAITGWENHLDKLR
jgi:hypothetical protein